MSESLDAFNALPTDAAAVLVATCLHADEWCLAVVRGRPYVSRGALEDLAVAAAGSLSSAGLAHALVAHPRIGDRPAGSGAPAEFSRAEQSGVAEDVAAKEALRRANVAYEERFGHVFLIRAAGRGTAEIMAEAQRRLGNDDDAEAVEVREQLGQIAVLRLRQVLDGLAGETG